LENAFAVIADPQSDQIVLRSVLTIPKFRHQGQATSLMTALFGQFPGKTWVVPAIFPEEMSVFFESLGFKLQELYQFQMESVFEGARGLKD
jgi:hypothetical protein